MKRRFVCCLLALVMCLALAAPVAADSGFIAASSEFVTVEPETVGEDGSVTAGTADKENTNFYPGTNALKVTVENPVADALYMVFLLKGTLNPTNPIPTDENTILYIDQPTYKTENGSFVFDVKPSVSSLSNGDMTLLITSSSEDFGDGGYITYKLSYDAGITIIKGDVNSDTFVNSTDALACLQYVIDPDSLSDTEKQAADVNSDNSVNSTDALWILETVVGKRDKDTWEEINS